MPPSSRRALQLSKYDIENRILDYFVERFHRPPTELKRTTNLKIHFNFDDDSWPDVSAGINDESWMKSLNVEIDPTEMEGKETAAALAGVIWGKLSKTIHVTVENSALDSFQTLWADAIFPSKTPRKAGKARKISTKKPASKKRSKKKASNRGRTA